MRVVEMQPLSMTLATLDGHPLAGIVKFTFEENEAVVRFEVHVHERAAGTLDSLLMASVGGLLQDANWVELVERVVEASGGVGVEGIRKESRILDGEEAERAEALIEDLLARLHRKQEATI